MSFIRGVGKGFGKVAGLVVGGPIQVVGELTGVELIEDIGRGVRKASEFAGDTAGQVVGGAVDTVAGMVSEDPIKRDKGLSDIGNAAYRTGKGVFITAKDALHNGGEVIGGVMDGDHNRVKSGAASLVKTVAIGALAVGVIDIIDGADGENVAHAEALDTAKDALPADIYGDGDESITIETRNDHLEGSVHHETNVLFESNTIVLPSGTEVTGVFPVFESEYEVQLDESLYLQSSHVHFSYANAELYEAIQEDPNLADDLGLNEQDIKALANGDNPEGFTWHHHEEPGTLQLVDEEVHANTGHDGGREVWGGGKDYR
ncbi:HNH endonuclease [Cytobacillus sp. FJAT-53684]|uniref:HNH endonuclease n=1 Tax=Cytobacillus mangrovibacter TaxID=3299024 RepID=A0ABW6K2K4_9BACI